MQGEYITLSVSGSHTRQRVLFSHVGIDAALNTLNPGRYTTEQGVTLKNPTNNKRGYNFIGWTEDEVTVTEIPVGSLGDKTFVANAVGSYNQTSWFYSIFGNQKLIIMLTAIVFFVILAIAIYIHYKLTVKSYYANVEMEFLSSVVKITEHIDGEGKDKNVPKVVSQVIANDIKKNKTLNPEKPKDKDKDKNK